MNLKMCAVAAVLAIGFVGSPAQSAVLYSGGTYSQDFNGLPLDAPNNAALEPTPYANGWQDDTTTVAGDHLSIPGWYLWHPEDSGTEDGTNGHQRFRMGSGTATAGAFYGFATDTTSPADNTEKALGSLVSNTLAVVGASNRMGVRLTNNTANVLTEFTLRYNGEQWRNEAQPAAAEKLLFDYSLDATAIQTGTFTAVPALDFTAPVTTPNGSLDGNVAGRVNGITATVTGIAWLPGTDIWLRWSDENNVGTDDSLAIDDVTFSALGIPEPSTLGLAGLAALIALGGRRRN